MEQAFGRRTAVRKTSWGSLGLGPVFAAALLCAAGCSSSGDGSSPMGDELFASPDSSGNPPPGPGGAVLAELEIEAPTRSPFVLRGTLPVPPGTFPRLDGLVPLGIRNVDGNVVATQVQIVSRYANDLDGADVVEVLGRVDLAPGTNPGQRVRYQVVDFPHPDAPLPISQQMLSLLLGKQNAVLVAEDCFGNQYQADLFEHLRAYNSKQSTKLLRKGEAAVQLRTYSVMLPNPGTKSGPPNGALPHFLGVHAYVTAWANTEALSLDLRVHNGFDGNDKNDSRDDPLGDVYFKKLELRLPAGWTAMLDVNDPSSGAPYKSAGGMLVPLIVPEPNGKMHAIPHQFQFNRRMGISRVGDEALALHLAYDEGLAFCRRGVAPGGADLYSWWNPQTARYFPQRHVLPDLSWTSFQGLEAKLNGDYWMTLKALETGAPGNFQVPSPALGWAHPWGVAYGGMSGGSEINLYDGLLLAEVGSSKGWKAAQFTHRMVSDRQCSSLYNKWGDPTPLESWLIKGGGFSFVNMNFYMGLQSGPDPFGFTSVPQFQVASVLSQGLKPGYADTLDSFMPNDFQHYVRYTRTPKVLAWLGNDALAKDDLKHAAELFRMSFHEYPGSNGKGAAGSGLYNSKKIVQSNPNHGLFWGRGESWGLDVAVAAYSVADPSYRTQLRSWLEQCGDVLASGQMSCSGFYQAVVNPKWLNGAYKARSSIEQAITENALWGLKESVFRGFDPSRLKQTEQAIADSTLGMIGPMAWAAGYNAPYFYLATADLTNSVPPFCGSVPPGGAGNGPDNFQTWSSFAYGYELTKNQAFLQKASAMIGNPNLLQGLYNAGLGNITNQAALMATLQ